MAPIAFGQTLSQAFAQWLRRYMADHGISQAEAARQLNIAPATVQHIVSGRRRASSILIQRTFETLGLEAEPELGPYLKEFSAVKMTGQPAGSGSGRVSDKGPPPYEQGAGRADRVKEKSGLFDPKWAELTKRDIQYKILTLIGDQKLTWPDLFRPENRDLMTRALMELSLKELTCLFPEAKEGLDRFFIRQGLEQAMKKAPRSLTRLHSRMIESYEAGDYGASLAFMGSLFTVIESLDTQPERPLRNELATDLRAALTAEELISRPDLEALIRQIHAYLMVVFPDPVLRSMADNY